MAVSTPALIEIIDRTIEGAPPRASPSSAAPEHAPRRSGCRPSALDEPAYLAYSITKTFTASP